MFKLRKEKIEKIKNVLLQLSSNGNRMTGEIERQRLQSEKSEQLHTWVDTEMCPDTFLYPDTNVVPLRLHLKGYKRVSGNFYVAICIHLYLSKINIYKRQ